VSNNSFTGLGCNVWYTTPGNTYARKRNVNIGALGHSIKERGGRVGARWGFSFPLTPSPSPREFGVSLGPCSENIDWFLFVWICYVKHISGRTYCSPIIGEEHCPQ